MVGALLPLSLPTAVHSHVFLGKVLLAHNPPSPVVNTYVQAHTSTYACMHEHTQTHTHIHTNTHTSAVTASEPQHPFWGQWELMKQCRPTLRLKGLEDGGGVVLRQHFNICSKREDEEEGRAGIMKRLEWGTFLLPWFSNDLWGHFHLKSRSLSARKWPEKSGCVEVPRKANTFQGR